jgi:hypothetical protein
MKEQLQNIFDAAFKWLGIIVGLVFVLAAFTGYEFHSSGEKLVFLGFIMILSATKFPR